MRVIMYLDKIVKFKLNLAENWNIYATWCMVILRIKYEILLCITVPLLIVYNVYTVFIYESPWVILVLNFLYAPGTKIVNSCVSNFLSSMLCDITQLYFDYNFTIEMRIP